MGQDNKEITKENKPKMTVTKKVLFSIECVIIILCLTMSIFVLVNPGSVGKDGKPKPAQWLTVQTDSMEPTLKTHALLFTEKPDEGILPLNTIVTYVTTRDGLKVLNTHRIVGYRYLEKDPTSGYTDVFAIEYWSELGSVKDEDSFYEKYPSNKYEIISYVTRGDLYTQMYSSFTDYSVDNSGLALEAKEGWDDSNPYLSLEGVVAVYSGRKIDGIGAFIDYIKTPLGVFIVIMLPLILLLVYQIISLIRIVVKFNVAKVKEEVSLSEDEIKKRAIEEYLKSQNIVHFTPEPDAPKPEEQPNTNETEQK